MPEKDYVYDLLITDRLRMQLLTERGKIQKALCQYETQVDGEWTPVVRYDTAHGFFHKDVFHVSGTKEKRNVNYVDLDSAVKDAYQDIVGNWKSYKFRFFSKKKKRGGSI